MKGHMQRIIAQSDKNAMSYAKRLDLNPQSRDYGALFDPVKGFVETSSDAHFAGLLCLYYNELSKYHLCETFLDHADLMLDHMLLDMNQDGTLDLRETNFHDATSMGFALRVLGYTYQIVDKFNRHTPKEEQIKQKLYDLLVRGGEGMRTGGFHTPNHRWVLSSALALVYTATKDARLLDTINAYLNEGIDINEDGDYNEQSVSIYDIITNDSLIIIAEQLDRPELLKHVERNLSKLPCYWEPDGTVNTLNSHRQDHGVKAYPTGHYSACAFMAHKTKNPLFAAMAEALLVRLEEQGAGADITRYMLYPEMNQAVEIGEIPQAYELYLPDSGIMRYRSGNATVTLLENNPIFMKYQAGGNTVLVRMCGSFYAKGQFKAQSIEKTQAGYRMRYFQRWGYKRPLAEKPETSDWRKQPHELREPVNMQDYEILIDVTPDGETVHIDVNADCRDANVPCKLELIFQSGGQFETPTTMTFGVAGGSVVLREADGVYVKDYEGIRVEGGQAFHYYTRNMRGALPAPAEAFTVYTTFFTPNKKRVTLSPASCVTQFPPFK